MDATKEFLIDRLLKEGKISQDDANVLRRKEQQEIVYITPPPQPLNPLPRIGNTKQDWINEELNRRAKVAENCGCNPANGGSGMCGCTLASPFIMC